MHDDVTYTIQADYGSKLDEPTEPSRLGYTFTGWYKDGKYNDKWDFDTDTVAGDTTLYAKWTGEDYKATFVGNFTGTTYSTEVDEVYGSKYVLPETNPTRDGYDFDS